MSAHDKQLDIPCGHIGHGNNRALAFAFVRSHPPTFQMHRSDDTNAMVYGSKMSIELRESNSLSLLLFPVNVKTVRRSVIDMRINTRNALIKWSGRNRKLEKQEKKKKKKRRSERKA